MDILIADTFTDSLVRLTGDEQKAVKTTAFDLHLALLHREGDSGWRERAGVCVGDAARWRDATPLG